MSGGVRSAALDAAHNASISRCTSCGPVTAVRCCCTLGERSPASVPRWLDGWTGPVAALDFTGHGSSTIPTGGGYTAEAAPADADAALAALGRATVFGRGLGAYIALQLAGLARRT